MNRKSLATAVFLGFFYLEEGLDGRHMAGTFSSAVLIHIITNLFNVDRRDYV